MQDIRQRFRNAAPMVRSTAPISPAAPSLITSSGQASPRSPSPVKKPSQASPDSDDVAASPTDTGVDAPPGQHRFRRGVGVIFEVAAVQKQVVQLDVVEAAGAPGLKLGLELAEDPRHRPRGGLHRSRALPVAHPDTRALWLGGGEGHEG